MKKKPQAPPPPSVDEIIAYIRRFVSSRQMSTEDLAVAAGLSGRGLKNINNKNWNPTADTLRRLQRVIAAQRLTDGGEAA